MSIDVVNGPDGFRGLRPENCLSVTAGLVLGPIGGLACSLGNLISDCFHGMYQTAFLGFAGNSIMAFVPYKLWMMLACERPDAHTWMHLLRYVWVLAVGAMACACFLGIGLDRIYFRWYDGHIVTMFTNNFVFSLAFGLPLFIVLTSERVGVMLKPKSAFGKFFTYGLPIRVVRKTENVRWTILAALTASLTVLMLLINNGQNVDDSFLVQVFAVVSSILLFNICVLPIAGRNQGAQGATNLPSPE